MQPPSPERLEWIQTAYHWLEALPAVGLAVLGGVVRALRCLTYYLAVSLFGRRFYSGKFLRRMARRGC